MIPKVIGIYLLGIMNVHAQINGNKSNLFRHFTENNRLSLMLAQDSKSEHHQNH